MKKWIEIDISSINKAVFQPDDSFEALCLRLKVARFTRIDKYKRDILDFFESDRCNQFNRIILFIDGNPSKTNELFESLDEVQITSKDATNLSIVLPSHFIDKENNVLVPKFDNPLFNNVQLILDLDSKISNRRYEPIIVKSKKNDIDTVLLHKANFSKGDVALAHRFGLKTIVMDVLYQYEQDAVENAKSDICMVRAR